jgi:DNA-binding LacI/PurR family transcriptional regulator
MAEPRPTAIFACSDWVAFEIYTVAKKMGIRIPTELSIVGYSDTHKLSHYITPPLTTIRQYPNTIGQTAAKLMVDYLDSEPGLQTQKHINIECKLTIRESTQRI